MHGHGALITSEMQSSTSIAMYICYDEKLCGCNEGMHDYDCNARYHFYVEISRSILDIILSSFSLVFVWSLIFPLTIFISFSFPFEADTFL